MSELPADPDAIYHLATPSEWSAAEASGSVVPPGFATEGFVHCSTGAQLQGTVERHFAGEPELVLLRLHPSEVRPDLRWEGSRPGEAYPHVYRPLVPSDVAEVIRWTRG